MSSESVSARPEVAAFRDLAQLVRHLEDELASFRRRALSAEARVKELESAPGAGSSDVAELATQNAQLTKRLDADVADKKELLRRVGLIK